MSELAKDTGINSKLNQEVARITHEHAEVNMGRNYFEIDKAKDYFSVNAAYTSEPNSDQDSQSEQSESFQYQCFTIEDKAQAIWAIRKLAKKKKDRDANIKAVEDEIKRLHFWLEVENSELDHEVRFFESLLHRYFMELRNEDKKLKSVKLPHGVLKMRKQQAEFHYQEDELLAWAKTFMISAVQTSIKESVVKSVIKEHIKETGEVIPGVTIIPREEKFTVEVHD